MQEEVKSSSSKLSASNDPDTWSCPDCGAAKNFVCEPDCPTRLNGTYKESVKDRNARLFKMHRCSGCSALAGERCAVDCPVAIAGERQIKEFQHKKIQPSSLQVGGAHYKNMVIQPGVFCEKNGLSLFESNVVKRMCRWKTRGKPLEDLRKAKHEIDLLIEIHEVTE